MGENFAHFSAVIYTRGTTTNKRSSQPTSQLKQLNELDKNLANPFESVVALERRLWSIGASLKANDRVKIIYSKYCFLFVFFLSVLFLFRFSFLSCFHQMPRLLLLCQQTENCLKIVEAYTVRKRYKQTLKYIYDDLE